MPSSTARTVTDSSKPSIVRDHKTCKLTLYHFGWKASAPSIHQQSTGAFAGNIGTSLPDVPRHWGDCTGAQAACRAMPNGVQDRLGTTEATDPIMYLMMFYSQNLAVPEQRDINDQRMLRGKQMLYEAGCSSCHTPKFVTRRDAPNIAQKFQLIWPYSDLLLHDIGAEIGNGQQVGDAPGNEWRPPLL